mgnify:FL=1
MSPLTESLIEILETSPQQFHDLVDKHATVSWKVFLRAWGELRELDILKRDDAGAYYISNE